MKSYLEILALGVSIVPRNTGLGRNFRTDGVFVMQGPKELGSTVRIAVEERYELAKQVLAGHKTDRPCQYGTCDMCGMAQEDFYAGPCKLCRTAMQRIMNASSHATR